MAVVEGQRASGEEVYPTKLTALDRSIDQFRSPHSGRIMPLQESGLMSPPPRPESLVSRASNRLSLSLPIQAGDRDAGWPPRLAPPDSNLSSRQASPSLDIDPKLSPNASSECLVALAAQERRVFELKEELQQAENELKKLKRQWAIHEASRNMGGPGLEKRQLELRSIQPTLSGIKSTTGDKDDNKPMRSSQNIDVDQRKAMLVAATKDSRRKVISGGHTRALSLLSPPQGSYGQDLPVSSVLNSRDEHAAAESVSLAASQYPAKLSSNRARHSYQDTAATGVKQIAEDIKSGLWTFMEDLRQATVGEEAIKRTSSVNGDITMKRSGRKGTRENLMTVNQSLTQSPQGGIISSKPCESGRSKSMPMVDAGKLDHGTEMIAQTPTATWRKVETESSLDDNWSNWDSPVSKEESGRWSNSTALSSREAGSGSSPSNRSSSPSKRDEVAWPVLHGFAPSNIKRTASAIMKEWEKSLMPPSIDERKDPTSSFPKFAKKTTDEDSRLLLNNLP